MIYLAGSLRNGRIAELQVQIENHMQVPVFADWFAAGPEADDYWKKYYEAVADQSMTPAEKYVWALQQPASQNVYLFDKKHIDASKLMVLVLPAGKSGHLELGYFLGCGKPGIIFLDNEKDFRWDVMYNFASDIAFNTDNLLALIESHYPKEQA